MTRILVGGSDLQMANLKPPAKPSNNICTGAHLPGISSIAEDLISCLEAVNAMGEHNFLSKELKDRLNDDSNVGSFEEWKKGSGADIHPALGAESHYDKQKAAFTVKKPHDDLKAALEAYRKAGGTIDFDVENCSWSDVLKQMYAAKDVYNSKGEKNKVRGLFRHGTTISTTLTPLLGLIPNQWGLNVLSAGLALIFQAVQKRDENREKIFRTFEDIPDMIDKAQTTRQTFPAEQSLQRCAQDLYETLLQEIPELIKILLRKYKTPGDPSGPAWYKRVSNQMPEAEQSNIDQILTRVTKESQKLKSCIEDIVNKKIAETHRNTTEGLQETKAIRQTASSTHVRVGNISKDLQVVGKNVQEQREEVKVKFEHVEGQVQAKGEEIKTQIVQVEDTIDTKGEEVKAGLLQVEDKVQALDDKISQFREEFQESRKASTQNINQVAANIQTGIYYIVIERTIIQDKQPQAYRPQTPAYYQKASMSFLELLDILNMERLTAPQLTEDLDHVLKKSNSFDSETLNHARWLMSTENFKIWLVGRQSDLLLVDGHCDRAKTGKTSPMSVFCASLVASLVNPPPDRPPSGLPPLLLHFFCGQHAALHDPLRGPHGMMRSLITQLLLSPGTWKPNLDFMNSQLLYNDLVQLQLEAICHVFQELVRQVPIGITIYCIIDGISEYERIQEGWKENLRLVVGKLQQITFDPSFGQIFKLLMTSANKSTDIVHQVAKEQHVSLRAGHSHSRPMSQQSFSKDIRRARTPVGDERFPSLAQTPGGTMEYMSEGYPARFG